MDRGRTSKPDETFATHGPFEVPEYELLDIDPDLVDPQEFIKQRL
jgi:hypothetical protein